MICEPKDICNILINSPENDRLYIINNIKSMVFVSWVVQIKDKTLDKRDFQKRIEDYRTGNLELKDWMKK